MYARPPVGFVRTIAESSCRLIAESSCRFAVQLGCNAACHPGGPPHRGPFQLQQSGWGWLHNKAGRAGRAELASPRCTARQHRTASCGGRANCRIASSANVTGLLEPMQILQIPLLARPLSPVQRSCTPTLAGSAAVQLSCQCCRHDTAPPASCNAERAPTRQDGIAPCNNVLARSSP